METKFNDNCLWGNWTTVNSMKYLIHIMTITRDFGTITT